MIKDVQSNVSSKIAIREIGVIGDSLRIVFDLFSTQGVQLNDDPVERTISLSELSDMRQEKAWSEYKKDKNKVKITYEDPDHLVRNTDPFFLATKKFVEEATKTASEFLSL